MIKVYPGDDFTLKFPGRLAGKIMPEGSTVSIKIFTINMSESYRITVSDNPIPKTVKLSANILNNMVSGVVQAMFTANIPDVSMDDSFFNYSTVQSTDYFWISSDSGNSEDVIGMINDLDASVRENYATKASVTALEGDLTALSRHVDNDFYTSSSIDANYYLQDTIDQMFADLDSSVSTNYATKASVTSVADDLALLDSSVSANYAPLADFTTLKGSFEGLYEDVSANYATKTWSWDQFYTKSDIDTSIAHNYYSIQGVDNLISGLDSSVANHLDASIGSIQTALNAIINN